MENTRRFRVLSRSGTPSRRGLLSTQGFIVGLAISGVFPPRRTTRYCSLDDWEKARPSAREPCPLPSLSGARGMAVRHWRGGSDLAVRPVHRVSKIPASGG